MKEAVGMEKQLKNQVVCDEIVLALRKQQHDFINHIQVIQAYLQIGKVDRALRYLDGIAHDVGAVERIVNELNCKNVCQILSNKK